jgi:Glycosyl hydrolases family 39
MEKSKLNRFTFSRGKEKKGLITRVFGLFSLSLVLALIIMLVASHIKQATYSKANTIVSSLQDGVSVHSSGSPTATGTKQPTIPASAADITVDFANRQNTAYPIPSTFLGVGGVGFNLIVKSNQGNAVLQANFHLTKLGDYDFMSQIFPTAASVTNPSQQNWSTFDQQMTLAANYNMLPMISLEYTPNWLQPQNQSPPQTNPCLTYNPPYSSHSAKPMYLVNGQDRGPQMWGQLAAQVVAHVDHHYPQSHALYEIWNQPDGSQFLCVPKNDPNADQDRLTYYRAMFAAAAPLMKQQASRDGVQIQIGGPALVYALQNHLSTWLPTLLNDPAIYPYINFISYHRYLAGSSFFSGSSSLVATEQDAMFGVTAQYEQVLRIVRSGRQPNASNTPIYIDEYSMSSCNPVVCQNDPTYSPLMNAIFIIDYLNAVNDKKSPYGAAARVPAGLAFYSWDIPLHYLCMFGAFDAKMDCGAQFGTTIQPYPAYYTYKLFGASNYLDLTNGGFVANTTLVKPAGTLVSGFFTRSHDSVVVINPTSQAFTSLHVFVQNPGNVSGKQANVFTLKFNSSNPANSISTSQVNLIPVTGGTGYMAIINVPAYTTVGLTVGTK